MSYDARAIVDLTVLLTVFKRKTLREQLNAILRQTVKPAQIIVFQNERHVRLPIRELRKSGVAYVQNSTNTKFFGRFAHLLTAETEFLAVFDDDVIPGTRCLENYLAQAQAFNGIIGGNGRIGRTNPLKDELIQPTDFGVRPHPTLVDFVGHVWVFKKARLHDMFSIPPVTFATGEDMHLCFASKLRSSTRAYVAAQATLEDSCDVRRNQYADDEIASFRHTPKTERERVEEYFGAQGLKFITPAEQQEAAQSLASW